jgi:hypothetical protein
MAHREKHRIAAQVKRAGSGRKIKSDLVPGTKRTTEAYKVARKEAKRQSAKVDE